MRLQLVAMTLLLGTLQAFPRSALSYELSEVKDRQDVFSTSDDNLVGWEQSQFIARRPRAASPSTSQPSSNSRSSTRRSQPSRQPTSSPRSRPSASESRPARTVRQAQPQRRSQPKVTRPKVTRPKVTQPKSTPARSPGVAKSQPPKSIKTKQPGSKRRSQPQTSPKSTVQQKTRPVTSPSPSRRKLATPTPTRRVLRAKPNVVNSGHPSKAKVQPKPAIASPKSGVVVKTAPRSVEVKSVRTRPTSIQPSHVRVRRNSSIGRRRSSGRRSYQSHRSWGSRPVYSRRLTRAYRPCYYCPGVGWSYSPNCYTRSSRYYVFSDSFSYWPNTTTYVRRNHQSFDSRPTLNQTLKAQVEAAIQDYSELYGLASLNEDIQVSQEGSVIILTGVVDLEETLDDLIAIARDINDVKYVIAEDVVIRELEDEPEVILEDEPKVILEDEPKVILLEDESVDSDFDPLQTGVVDLGVDLSREEVIDLGFDLPREEVIELGVEGS